MNAPSLFFWGQIILCSGSLWKQPFLEGLSPMLEALCVVAPNGLEQLHHRAFLFCPQLNVWNAAFQYSREAAQIFSKDDYIFNSCKCLGQGEELRRQADRESGHTSSVHAAFKVTFAFTVFQGVPGPGQYNIKSQFERASSPSQTGSEPQHAPFLSHAEVRLNIALLATSENSARI